MTEHRGRDILENLADGVVVHDPETGEILDINRRALEMFGYNRDTLIGAPVDTITAGDRDKAFDPPGTDSQQTTDNPVQFELALEDADGEQFAARVHRSDAEFDDERKIVSSIRNRSDGDRIEPGRKRTAEQAQYERMVETVSDGIYVLDDDLRFSMVNGSMETITGYHRDELLGAPLSKIIDTEGSIAGREAREELLASDDDVMAVENQVQTASGETKPCEFRFTVFSSGEGISTVGVVRDITERKERERALESYRVLFENTSDCIVQTAFVDDEPIIRMVNAAFEETFGYAEEEIVGRSLDDVVVPEDRLEEGKAINRRGKQGETVREEVTRETRDGRREFLVRSVHFDDGRSFAVYTDITRRKRRERELRETKAELEASNERLQQFAYVASHDLQEPLRMMSSYIELLEMELGDVLTDEQREYMEFAVDGAERMKAMIDGLLQYSRVQTQADPFASVNVGDVVEETLQDLSLKIETADADVTVGDMPTVTADRNQLGQVFQNLLKNALEHGGETPIVEVTASEHADDVEFVVADDGPSIPEQQQDAIFDIFDTGTDSDGTGIGLAVCKRIVDRHGGDIWVKSADGDGTRFHFTIPEDPGRDGQLQPGPSTGEQA